MLYKIAADSVVVIHLAFILFVVLGGFFIYRYQWLLVFHLPAMIWGGLIEFYGWACPLTPLEKKFRLLAGEAGYEGSFVDQYLLIYMKEPDRILRPLFPFLHCIPERYRTLEWRSLSVISFSS